MKSTVASGPMPPRTPAGATGWIPAEEFTLIHDGVSPAETEEARTPIELPIRQLSLDLGLSGVVDTGSGEDQYAGTAVFQAEGQFWVPKDRAEVCVSPGNQVPEAIYQPACETN